MDAGQRTPFSFRQSSQVKLRFIRICMLAAAFLADIAVGEGQELAWVRQMGSPAHDESGRFDTQRLDEVGLIYNQNELAGRSLVGKRDHHCVRSGAWERWDRPCWIPVCNRLFRPNRRVRYQPPGDT